MTDTITIDAAGMRAFRRDIAAVDKALVKELGQSYKAIGTMIQADAATKARSVGGVAAKAAQAGAVKATARTTDVAVKLNAGVGREFAYGAEFGGGRKPTTHQFRPYRGNGRDAAGYFLYPAIRDDEAKILDAYDKAVATATARAFPHHH